MIEDLGAAPFHLEPLDLMRLELKLAELSQIGEVDACEGCPHQLHFPLTLFCFIEEILAIFSHVLHGISP